ncbi:MAG: dihydropteroate synthase [Gammaproteobacteria bacterium]|nr:dihydropteroate synthase [Gammaproteobacteria bacterium]
MNITSDSSSNGGEFHSIDAAVRHAGRMVSAGTDIIDVGGESTRPGASRISVAELRSLSSAAPGCEVTVSGSIRASVSAKAAHTTVLGT